MNTAVSLPDKNSDEATKITVGFRWYIIEHHAEGCSADLALLTPEFAEAMAKVINSTEDTISTIRFYDEGYSGYTEIRTDLGGFKTKKEAIDKWRAGKRFIEDDDILIDIEEEEE